MLARRRVRVVGADGVTGRQRSGDADNDLAAAGMREGDGGETPMLLVRLAWTRGAEKGWLLGLPPASLGAEAHLLPVARPFLAPGEGPAAGCAGLGGQSGFGNAAGHQEECSRQKQDWRNRAGPPTPPVIPWLVHRCRNWPQRSRSPYRSWAMRDLAGRKTRRFIKDGLPKAGGKPFLKKRTKRRLRFKLLPPCRGFLRPVRPARKAS